MDKTTSGLSNLEELTEEQKKDLLDLILSVVVCISDKEYQYRVWIRGEGPEVDDFDETVCYYSGITNDVFKNYKEYDISDIQLSTLQKFHDAFQKFSDDNDYAHDFIEAPEWAEIIEMAKDVLKAFDCTKEKNKLAVNELIKRANIRIQTRKLLLENIAKISNEKNHVIKNGDNDDAFIKAIDYYFDKIGSILDDYRNYEISIERITVLKRFHEKFQTFWKSKDSPQFKATPEWNEIIELAKDVLKAFKYYREEEAVC